MWLHDLGMGEYLNNKYALWIDFRTIDENTLHGTGRRVGIEGGGITLQIKKKVESDVVLNAYIYLIMNAQLSIQNGAFVSAIHQQNADDARTPYGAVCSSNRSRKNTRSLGFTRAGVP